MPDKNGMTEVSFKLNPSELADVERDCEQMGVKRASWAKWLLVAHARRAGGIVRDTDGGSSR